MPATSFQYSSLACSENAAGLATVATFARVPAFATAFEIGACSFGSALPSGSATRNGSPGRPQALRQDSTSSLREAGARTPCLDSNSLFRKMPRIAIGTRGAMSVL